MPPLRRSTHQVYQPLYSKNSSARSAQMRVNTPLAHLFDDDMPDAEDNNTSTSAMPHITASKSPEVQLAPSTSWELRVLKTDAATVVVGVDCGVGESSIEWGIVRSADGITSTTHISPKSVTFQNNNLSIPMELGVVEESEDMLRIVWDYELLNCIKSGAVLQKDMVKFPKLSLLSGREREVFEPRVVGYTPQEMAYALAESVERSHKEAMQRWSGKTVKVDLPYTNQSAEVKLSVPQDFLKIWLVLLLYQLKGDIRGRNGGSWEDINAIMDKSVVAIAAPESWTDEMIDELRIFAVEAGFRNVRIVSEAKTSALAVVYDYVKGQDRFDHNISGVVDAYKNDIMIVVDHGAGTVDVTSVYVESLDPKLVLRTAFQATSVLRGAHFLNEIFLLYLPQLLGHSYEELVGILRDSQYHHPESLGDSLKRAFEQAKRGFTPGTGEAIIVECDALRHLPQQVGRRSSRPETLEVPASMMMLIFNEHFKEVYKSIEYHINEIDARPELRGRNISIVCVGGGSRSKYFEYLMQEYFRKANLAILKEDLHGRSSLVAYGAMLSAMDPDLARAEYARTSYGTEVSIKFNPSKHIGLPRFYAPGWTGYQWEIRNRVYWGLRIGAPLSRNDNVSGSITFYTEKWPYTLKQKLVKTRDRSIGLTDDQDGKHPYIQRGGMTLSMKVEIDQQNFELYEEKGVFFYDVHFRGIPVWDGIRAKWDFVVHKSGRFPNNDIMEYKSLPGDYLCESCELSDVLAYGRLKNNES